jgi:MoxR-like ATPase
MEKIEAGRRLIEVLKLCYRANRPPLLSGRHGVGKSVLLEQAAKQLGINFICRDLSLMEAPDLVGLPKIAGHVTTYAPPAFLPTGGRGLLVFEEINRAPAYMRAPCLQLLTARTLNDYTLPQGWLPAAAINPAADGYECDDLDEALLSRFVQLDVVPDRDEWLAWAETAGIHPAVIAYVRSDTTHDCLRHAEEQPAGLDIRLRRRDGGRAIRGARRCPQGRGHG